MNTLKRLTLSFTLIAVLAMAAFAGETLNPPCAPGETGTPPSELQGPPCASQSVNDDSAVPGEFLTPPAPDTVDVVDIVSAVRWSLSLF